MFLLQSTNNIFTKHFIYDMSLIDQPVNIISGKLFDQYNMYKKDISGYLFQASNINKEIIDFIQKFNKNTKIYLYFDKFNLQLYNDASSMIRCIIREDIAVSKQSQIKQKNTIKVNAMYSEQLINSIKLPENKIETEDIISDISDIEKLPEPLEAILYPNSKFRLKLFNSYSINVSQNLGFIEDTDMIHLINQCKMYIDTNLNYLLYSIILDKPTIALENNSFLKKTKDITEENILSIDRSKLQINDIIKNSYKNFIQKHIL
jgi:hypothetical protein